MHILFLSNYWPPEIGASSHLTFEMGETLVGFGHRVTVVTGFPTYNLPSLPPKYRGRWLFEEEMAGMRVLRIAVPGSQAQSKVRRGWAHLASPALYALRTLPVDTVDVVYTVSPPLPMGLSASAVATRFGAPCCLGVQDLFPQNAIDLGLLRNHALIRFLEAMERATYRSAEAITVHSEGNRRYVVSRGGRPERVQVVPNWVDTEWIRPGNSNNEVRRTASLNGEFLVVFAGTMGWSQGLGVVVDAARQLASEPDLAFLLVGDGTDRANLESKASGLSNVRFLSMQPKELYPSVLAAADACLVTLRPEVATPVVPSKLLTIMAAERPVLASLPLFGDAPQIISESGCGITCPAGDAKALAQAVLFLKNQRTVASEMARRGRRFAEANFSRVACVRRFERVFQEARRAA
ncbi:MAG: glycosyltransferase family 4 protein [Acidobacteria bacterium]|nr:glycosyltransferase family 4 protein [Acidobacteriota bacterium]